MDKRERLLALKKKRLEREKKQEEKPASGAGDAKKSASGKLGLPANRVNIAKMNKLLDAHGSEADFFRFQNGKTRCVFLMNPEPNSDRWWEVQRRHFCAFPDEKRTEAHICRKVLGLDEYCPICAFVDGIRRNVNAPTDVKKLAEELRVAELYLCNVAILENKSWTLKLAQCPFTVYKGVAQAILAETTDDDIAADGTLKKNIVVGPPEPRLAVVSRKGTGKQSTKYEVSVTAKVVELPNKLYEQRVDCSRFVVPATEADLNNVLERLLGYADPEEAVAALCVTGEDDDMDVDDDDDDDEEDADIQDDLSDDDLDIEDDADTENDTEQNENIEDIPDCFGVFEKEKMKERGCKTCKVRTDCVDISKE